MKEKRNKTGNVPNLRFKGFEGEWGIKKLGEVAEIKTGNKDTQNKVNSGKYPFYVRSNNVERINSYSFDGEAILTSGDGVGVGKNFHYIDGRFDFHQRVYSLRKFKEGYSGKYIYYAFSEKFYNRVIKLSAKNSVDSVRMDMIADMEIFFPSILEQQEVASFLTLIDERIDTQSKIIENLETLIKGLYQKTFNQRKEGFESVPLGSICIISKGKQINSSELSKVGKYYVMNGGVLPSGYHFKYNTEANIISISEGGNSCGYVQYNETRFWSGGHCYTLNGVNSNIRNKYLYYYLKASENDIMKLRVGSGLPNIQKKSLDGFQVLVPSIEEQEKIIAILDSLSNKLRQCHS